MYELRIQKNKIRSLYIDKRHAISLQEKKIYDEKICSLFMSLVTYRYSDILLMYYPSRGEIDVLPIAQHALENGKRIAFPRCDMENNTNTMKFFFVKSLEELTPEGAYGIPEPPANNEIYKPENFCGEVNAVCLVPAIVYDKKGYRLGYGKGYYDRYLTSFSGTKVGFVYSDFIVGSVPRGKYDLSVDVLVTEKGVRALGSN